MVCKDKEQNLNQMKNRGKGLIDLEMLEKDYRRKEKYPRDLLPNEVIIDVTGKSADSVLKEAINILTNTESLLNYDYVMPDRRCFGTWV